MKTVSVISGYAKKCDFFVNFGRNWHLIITRVSNATLDVIEIAIFGLNIFNA